MTFGARIRPLLLLFSTLLLISCAEFAYRHMNDPSRDAWQKPKEVIQELSVAAGSRVADLGAGGGYFTWYLADAVGPQGLVYAIEIDETALRIIERERAARRIPNVVLVKAEPHDTKLPQPVDLVFSCDTYHHMTVSRISAHSHSPSRLRAEWPFWISIRRDCFPACSGTGPTRMRCDARWKRPAIGSSGTTT